MSHRRRNRADEVMLLDPEVVHVGGRLRSIDERRVTELMESVKLIGIRSPITYRYVPEMMINGVMTESVPVLVAGLHRLEAARRLGIDVPALEIEADEITMEMWEIAENLHRYELTVNDRSDHIDRWLKLLAEKNQHGAISRQLDEKSSPGRPEGGVAAAARGLGISEADARRAVKIASLTPEAKEAARSTGLDNNQSALLRAAKAPAERQEQAIRNFAAEKAARPARSAPPPEPSPEFTEAQEALRCQILDLIGSHLTTEGNEGDAAEVVCLLEKLKHEVEDPDFLPHWMQVVGTRYVKGGAA